MEYGVIIMLGTIVLMFEFFDLIEIIKNKENLKSLSREKKHLKLNLKKINLMHVLKIF